MFPAGRIGSPARTERPLVSKWSPSRTLPYIISLSLLDLRSNPCNNYSVHPDEFGGVSVWQKYGFKKVKA